MRRNHLAPWGLALALAACGGPKEAPRVELEVVADASGIVPVTTDLGYTVELSEARVMVENLQFAIAGEAHGSRLWRRLSNLVVPTAQAHPGHFQGGDVTGELRGRFVVQWLPSRDAVLGTATLLAGQYHSANFTFARATEADGLASDDPLVGHTAFLRGQASRGEKRVDFAARIDSPSGRQLMGAPFELTVTPGTPSRLGLRLVPADAHEGDTLFDGLDFDALDGDGDGSVVLEEATTDAVSVDAYNQLRRTLQTHDHFDVQATPTP